MAKVRRIIYVKCVRACRRTRTEVDAKLLTENQSEQHEWRKKQKKNTYTLFHRFTAYGDKNFHSFCSEVKVRHSSRSRNP